MKLSTTDELDRISGERRPGNSTPRPLKLPVGAGGRQDGGHVPKAQGLKRRGRSSRPCNREGARRG